MTGVLIWQSSKMRILAVAEKIDFEIFGLPDTAFLLKRFRSGQWARR